MPRKLDHTYRERQFGRELCKLRKQACLSMEEVSQRVDIGRSKIGRFELGQLPRYHELIAMLDLYGVSPEEAKVYAIKLEDARAKGWWRAYSVTKQAFTSLEAEADQICAFQKSNIPGLFQTKPYMLSVFDSSSARHSRKWNDNQVAIRLRRQQRLTGANPLRYHSIIDEGVLTKKWGSPENMREQLQHIIHLAGLPHVTVQVLLDTAGHHDGDISSFHLMSLPDPEEGDVLHTEYMGGSAQISDPEVVQAARVCFKDLTKLALSPEDSIRWIEQLIADT
ncbi:helix-turn-helix domain-containing protein [Solihabitans fulvus]|uniref:Helix-turn-helix domain-containing protein n=1 Tax=Solihabitans fulvus TaxID=1892852 RepID=A0A5B2WYB6_9PSEU|nr:helix-turn-helix transcriptional regulator [Solihabitans fulvus]KAA2255910.1 helix-turn-helix domain-containing protein [Solihabitans fulvus]